jgi:hypothetical protein
MNWFLKYWRLIKRGKTYRVILIDPEARSIKELQNDASMDTIHELVGAELLDHFVIARHGDDGGFDHGWVDDNGLARGKPVHAFRLPRKDAPVAGRCVIVGADRDGEDCSAKMSMWSSHLIRSCNSNSSIIFDVLAQGFPRSG